MKSEHIYIHFPFCVSKCPYCDFFSVAVNEASVHQKYIEYILKEIEKYKDFVPDTLKTLYIGGGTPSLIEPVSLKKIINRFEINSSTEVTLEVNPATVNADKLKMYYDLGINRLSVGSQSFIDKELKTLGRSHSVNDIYKTYENARKAGFKNINLDLIIGIPGQTTASIIYNTYEVTQLAPEHVSAYILTYYEDTPLARKLNDGSLIKLEDEIEIEFFDLTSDILEKHGLKRYEISNFSKEGNFSRHNMNTWDFGNYLGLGASAHSFINGYRWENTDSTDHYFKSVLKTETGISEVNRIDDKTLKNEFVILGLRKTAGLNINSYNEYFKSDFF
ncbi:MAG: radical SAM family heme chaperone HemW, partial [Candidatus Delongbacteria bacterium]|nr:radical SAM family heme chaperone HemW [Candidatus Delongbacteria bacterium]